ncbi:hypothetical protein Ahy_B06g082437 isoform D [Arachis hypogaea]|uniref:Uncharacterized protein n=1 Tax=Arachis hypogaea TaxID=3818 RepID=A0A444YNE1_ARAHY|nr:hypothetical protein Ahy_B06g082437 isoform D [Arachis hypogaea]
MNKSGANPTSIQLAGSLKPLHSPPSFELVAELLSSGLVSAAFLSTSATACKICCGHRNENRLLQKLRLQVLEHPPGEWRVVLGSEAPKYLSFYSQMQFTYHYLFLLQCINSQFSKEILV